MNTLSLVLALVALSPSQSFHGADARARAELRPRSFLGTRLEASGVPSARPRPAPAAVPDGSGGQYVAWSEVRDGDADLFLLRVTSSGVPAAGWPADGLAICNAQGEQGESALFPDGSGGVIAGWLDAREGWLTYTAYLQRVNASGVPQWTANGVPALSWNAAIGEVAAAPDGSGGLYLVWDQTGTDADIYGLRITGTGALAAGWSASGNLICDATGDQLYPAITGDGSGGAVIVWYDERDPTSHAYAQRVNGSGAAQWTANGIAVDESVDGVTEATVCAAAGGHSLVFWGDVSGPVLGQRLNGLGAAQWTAGGEVLHPGTSPGAPDGDYFAIPDGLDGAIVSWVSFDAGTHGIQTQRIDAAGAVQWGASGASLLSSAPAYPESFDATADGSGGAFFAWNDFRNGFDYNLFAQRVTAGGAVSWTANGLAVCSAPGEQGRPGVVLDGAGGVLVSWLDLRSADTEVYSQRINAAGTPQFAVNGIAAYVNPGVQIAPATVHTADGGVLLVWNEKRSGGYDIRTRKLNADGTPAGSASMVTDAAGHQMIAAVAEDGLGGAIVAWTDGAGGTQDLYARRISSAGVPLWSANGVAVCISFGPQESPSVVSDGAGGAILAWRDGRSGFGGDVYAQRISSAGIAQWTANGVAVCTDPGTQGAPRLASDGVGGAIIAWSDQRTFLPLIYAQRLNSSGVPQWAANGVPIADYSSSFGAAEVSAVIPGALNEAIVLVNQTVADLLTFELTSALHVQRVNGSGAPQWGTTGTLVCDASSHCFLERLVGDGSGGAFVAWSDDRSSPFDIYAQRVGSAGTVQWTANGNVVCDAAGWQYLGGITRSGSDLCLVWSDGRSGGFDVYAHRMDSSGNDVWAADGVVVSDEARGQFFATIAPWRTATPERLYVGWTDNRSGTQREVYAERLDLTGASQWTIDGVTSAAVSLASAEADPERVRLAWYGSEPVSATVERRTDATVWAAVGSAGSDGSGMIRFEDRDVRPGMRYGYRLAIRDVGGERYAGETWVEVPSGLALAIDGLRPNPAEGDLVVSLTLARSGDATLELLDPAGRRVRTFRFSGLAPGRHALRLDGERPAPGVYFLRLTQGGQSVTARGAVTR